MKRKLLFLSLGLCLVTPVKANAIYTVQSPVTLKGVVKHIEKGDDNLVIVCKVTQKGKWKNQLYAISIDYDEFDVWTLDEGTVKKGTKVKMMLDTVKTKSIYDDLFINVHK